MNDLAPYFKENDKEVTDKWDHYFEIYENHLKKYRGKEVVLLQIGAFQDGGLQMWKTYFGDKANIYGIGINLDHQQAEKENITVLTGSQSDRDFLKEAVKKMPPIDLLIDCGGSAIEQQIIVFEELIGHVKPDGIYLCEELRPSYTDGDKRPGGFIEYSKEFINGLNSYHTPQKAERRNTFTSPVNSLHYYDSVLVMEKRRQSKPHNGTTGTITLTVTDEPEPTMKSWLKSLFK